MAHVCAPPRLENLGVILGAHGLEEAAKYRLPAAVWDALRNSKRLLLTPSSVILVGAAADSLMAVLAGVTPSCTSLIAQYTSGVLVVSPTASDGQVVDAAAAESADLSAVKIGLASNRLLLVGCTSGAASPLRVIDERFLQLFHTSSVGSVVLESASNTSCMCDLDALLCWLRDELGRARAALPPVTTGAPSPSVVATVHLPEKRSEILAAGIGAGCSVYEPRTSDSPGVPPTIVQPALLRSLFAPPAPAPVETMAGIKRPRTALEAGIAAPVLSAAPAGLSLAVIVPYRSQPEQNRATQLARFAEYMPAFLADAGVKDFHILVIEQSADGLKFNRGKALNVGFAIASDATRAAEAGLGAGRRFNAFCFHDVDLLPRAPLAPWYARAPVPRPLHIAGAWPRYAAGNDTYIGGITTLSAEQFSRVNGFPNNFWGWGGEDDELRDRLAAAGLVPLLRPPAALAGAIRDVEEELGGERASTRLADGGRAEWRCMWKKELRAYHARTSHANGLRTLHYRLLGTRALAERVTVITVDLLGGVDVAAQMDDQTNGIAVSAATTSWLVDEMLRLETAPGSGEVAGGAAKLKYSGGGGGAVSAAAP